MRKIINWKIFSVLLILSIISVICVFPYVLTLQKDAITQMGQPVEIIFIAQLIQSAILFAILIFFGLVLIKKINFHLPLITAIIERRDYKKILKNILGRSTLFGIITAVAIYATDSLFTALGANITTHSNLAPIWQKLLAAFYGGITEEIIMRLFLMSFLVWIGMKLFRQNMPSKPGIWIAIVLSAIIFGLGHIPVTASITSIDGLVLTRAIILNGIGGIVFGWLFWKNGLEAAMIAHFTADVFLLTLLPLFFA